MKEILAKEPEKNVNREYKDSVFTDLFYEDEKAKENELALFNALFNTNYTLDNITIEKVRVENVIYMRLKNDVSFNIENRILVFSEHQSTLNGNMPLRDLLYVARVYETLVPVKDRYRAKTIPLPRPEFFVFYNGTQDIGEGYTQKISDAYYKDFHLDTNDKNNVSLELIVNVININTDSGNEILQKCHVLKEYSLFVETARKFKEENNTNYMQQAIEYCIKNDILAEYLSRKGSEVMNFLCAEYDYEMDIQVHEEEAYEDGFENGYKDGISKGYEKGIEKGIEKGELCKLINQICIKAKKSCSPEQIAEQLEENIDIINKIYQLGLNTTPQYNETEILNKLH